MHGGSLDIITWKQAAGWVVMAPRGKLGRETGRVRQDTHTRAHSTYRNVESEQERKGREGMEGQIDTNLE